MIRLAKASLLCLGLGLLLPGSSVNAQNGEAELATVLQRLLDSQVQEQDISGMAMIVRSADGIVVGGVSGHVNPPKEEAWTVDTPTAIGSITKTFIAVIVMQLVEEGKLSLDDTVDTWFPEQPRGKRITVRMLLSHTSGLANYITPDNVMDGTWDRAWTPQELVAKANKLVPVSEPGSKEAHYANTNFILLGMIIEQVTGNTWYEEVSTRIVVELPRVGGYRHA